MPPISAVIGFLLSTAYAALSVARFVRNLDDPHQQNPADRAMSYILVFNVSYSSILPDDLVLYLIRVLGRGRRYCTGEFLIILFKENKC